jgi:hypothetical protein
MFIAAKGQASQQPKAPVIVATDPPRFANCIAAVRRKLPRLATTSTATIRADCRELFHSLDSQVLDFLIRARWYEVDASAAHITITGAQVTKAFEAAKRQQFSTPAAFKRFLRATGQTVRDVLFRVRVNLTFKALVKKAHGNAAQVDQQAKRLNQASTICARLFAMADCASSG